MQGISVKGAAGVLGGVISSAVWTILAIFVHAVSILDPSKLATLQGASSLVVGAVMFYLVPETAVPPLVAVIPDVSTQPVDRLDVPAATPSVIAPPEAAPTPITPVA